MPVTLGDVDRAQDARLLLKKRKPHAASAPSVRGWMANISPVPVSLRREMLWSIDLIERI